MHHVLTHQNYRPSRYYILISLVIIIACCSRHTSSDFRAFGRLRSHAQSIPSDPAGGHEAGSRDRHGDGRCGKARRHAQVAAGRQPILFLATGDRARNPSPGVYGRAQMAAAGRSQPARGAVRGLGRELAERGGSRAVPAGISGDAARLPRLGQPGRVQYGARYSRSPGSACLPQIPAAARSRYGSRLETPDRPPAPDRWDQPSGSQAARRKPGVAG